MLPALRAGPGYPYELASGLGVSRQAMSNHLACLRGCGLVVAVPEARRVRNELADPRIWKALADLQDVALVSEPSTCGAADETAS